MYRCIPTVCFSEVKVAGMPLVSVSLSLAVFVVTSALELRI